MVPNRRISPYHYTLLVISLFWGTILVTMGSGVWTTKVPTIAENQPVAAQQVTTDIKGWMTFEEIAKHTGVPLQELYSLAKVPLNTDKMTTLKDASSAYGLIVDDFKTVLQKYMEQPNNQ